MLTEKPAIKLCEHNEGGDNSTQLEALEFFFKSRDTELPISVEKCAKMFKVSKARMWSWIRADGRYVVKRKVRLTAAVAFLMLLHAFPRSTSFRHVASVSTKGVVIFLR